jgi:hypothetical protein
MPQFDPAFFAPQLFWDGRARGEFRDPTTNSVIIPVGGALVKRDRRVLRAVADARGGAVAADRNGPAAGRPSLLANTADAAPRDPAADSVLACLATEDRGRTELRGRRLCSDDRVIAVHANVRGGSDTGEVLGCREVDALHERELAVDAVGCVVAVRVDVRAAAAALPSAGRRKGPQAPPHPTPALAR